MKKYPAENIIIGLLLWTNRKHVDQLKKTDITKR